jgi:hypothetical protein
MQEVVPSTGMEDILPSTCRYLFQEEVDCTTSTHCTVIACILLSKQFEILALMLIRLRLPRFIHLDIPRGLMSCMLQLVSIQRLAEWV